MGRMRSVAVFRNGQNSQAFDLPLDGTASMQALSDGIFACSRDVRSLFPTDNFLETMAAEGFLGFRLSDSLGQAIGLIGMAAGAGFTNIQVVKSVAEAFAPRAATELERKRREDLLSENEERYRAFISANPDAMWRIEMEQPVPLGLPEEEQVELICRHGYLAECNDALARLAGVETTGELTGMRFREFAARVNPNAIEELRSAVRAGFRTVTSETTHLDATGQPVNRLRIAFGIVEDGMLKRVWGTTRDITELRRAERAVTGSEKPFREFLEHVQLPAVILDAAGTVLFANDCFIELAGQSRDAVYSSIWLKDLVPDDERETWRQSLQADNEAGHAVMRFAGSLRRRNGRSRTIEWNRIHLCDREGGVTAVAAIGRDVTQERVLETRIRQAEKLEGMGRFAAGVAQELTSLLSAILREPSQPLRQCVECGPMYDQPGTVEEATIRCKRLIAQLMTFGRQESNSPAPINLDEIIESEAPILRTLVGDKIRLMTALAAPTELVYADRKQIQRVLGILVSNARDAMQQGGIAVIVTSKVIVVAGDVKYPGIGPGTYIRLEVADQGAGMTEEVRSHIFEPFFTTKKGKGTGLGLSTVYGVVLQSEGHIAVHSEPGEGTRVEILLPEQV